MTNAPLIYACIVVPVLLFRINAELEAIRRHMTRLKGDAHG